MVLLPPPTAAFGFGKLIHRSIDDRALPFLTPGVLHAINEGHRWADEVPRGSKDQYHFDDCEFDGATESIGEQYRDARASLRRGDAFWFFKNFGIGLHGAQDFYSHSNWVELGFPAGDAPAQSDLVDISGAQDRITAPWSITGDNQHLRDDIYVANDDWSGIPADAVITRGGTAGHVPTVTYADGTEHRLLVSGEGRTFAPGTRDHECGIWSADGMYYAGYSHDDDLNKDGPDNPGDNGDRSLHLHDDAAALAVLQTRYEWCRFVAESAGPSPAGLLMTLAVRPDGSPHPVQTPCAARPVTQSLVSVTATIVSIQVTDVRENGDDAGEVQVGAALFEDRSTFQASAHRVTAGGSIALHDGDAVPAANLPAPMAICVPPDARVYLAVNGWDNDSDGRRARSYFFDTGERANGSTAGEDDVLSGGAESVASLMGSPAIHRIVGDHLTVRYRIESTTAVGCGTPQRR